MPKCTKIKGVVEFKRCVVLRAPELYADEAFVAWLNDPKTAVATWHTSGTPGEYSDIFMHVDIPEGSDSDMPEHCWQLIMDKLTAGGYPRGTSLVVWLQNVED
jgi:hypothetical protein